MTEIRPVWIGAQIIEPGRRPVPEVVETAMDLDVAYACDRGVFGNKFDYEFTMRDAGGADVAKVTISLVVDYDIPPEYEPPPDAADFVTTTTGYFAVHPYARELLASMTARLGLPPLTLGLLQAGSSQPRAIRAARPRDSGRFVSGDVVDDD